VKRYVLLDRDGTIIVNKHYQKDPDLTELESNAAEGLRLLREAGFGLVLLTNQSGIGRGYFTVADLDSVNARMVRELGGGKDYFDGMYFCPHVEADNCRCRKPLPGLAEQAATELGFALSETFVIGDRESDIDMGKAVGATTILVRTGYGAKVEAEGLCSPGYVADDLLAAAALIMKAQPGNSKNPPV
jgi:D-glycero-D-manno-heptose 1,7-bisphosphate phosphatase